MARTITRYASSAVNVATYTVPGDKIAKVIITYVGSWSNGGRINVGDYTTSNGSGQIVYSYNTFSNETVPPTVIHAIHPGYILCQTNTGDFERQVAYVKESHILVAGQTVRSTVGSGATFNFLVIEEDI